MKKKWIIIALLPVLLAGRSDAQSDEVQQLLLNVEKLDALKKILASMKQGYEVVSKGYGKIRDISQGNFKLHQGFLDSLLLVSPTVQQYKKVAIIISYEAQLVREYKAAFNRFKASNLFNPKEIGYMNGLYDNLFDKSMQNLDELMIVLTSGKARMSDDERIQAIDRIYDDMVDKLSFLRSFNNGTNVLAVQRGRESVDTKVSQRLHGLPPTP
jgi:hypothetical protein